MLSVRRGLDTYRSLPYARALEEIGVHDDPGGVRRALRLIPAVLMVLTMVSFCASAAAAAPQPRLVTYLASFTPAFDGRYLAVQRGLQPPSDPRVPVVPHVYDTRDMSSYLVPDGSCGQQLDARSRLLLLSCSSGARVFNMSRRAFLDVPGMRPGDALSFVGRYWAGGCLPDNAPSCAAVYLNLRTGQRRSEPWAGYPKRDLDDPALGLAPDPRSPLREKGYSVRSWPPARPLRLRRPDGSRVLLDSCVINDGCSQVTLRAGVVTWSSGSRYIRAYNIRTGKRVSWSAQRALGRSGRGLRVEHSRYRILIIQQPPSGPITLWTAPLPR